MAFIPEDIEDRLLSQTMSAFKIYFFACKCRNHKDRTFRRPLSECRQKMPKASFYRGLAELEEEKLIKVRGETILWIAGDFSPVEKKYLQNDSLKNETKAVSKMIPNSLKNETKESQNRDSYYKEYQPIPALPENERDSAGADDSFEPFEVTEKIVDVNARKGIDQALHWIQTQKKLSRHTFPEAEWLDLLEAVAPEGINTTGKFKEFYLWVENLDWVETVSPKLLLGQIEKFKKRDELANKRQGVLKNAAQNGNGDGKGYRNSSDAGAEKRAEQIDAIIADANKRFKRPQLD